MFLSLALLLSGQVEAVATWSADKRFKDNGDKTITDSKTGLMWMKEDSYLHSGHWVNWFESWFIPPSFLDMLFVAEVVHRWKLQNLSV